MTQKRVQLPLTEETINNLHVGDAVLLSGVLLTGRDAAHKRLVAALDAGEALPVEIKGETIYYVGPCPTPPGKVIGSAGPTTSGRMDSYAPRLMAAGLKGMIGKGERSQPVIEAMTKHKAIYFAALGGAGALISQAIKSVEVLAYPELGAEAIRRLIVEELPVIVAVDAAGNDLYKLGREKYAK